MMRDWDAIIPFNYGAECKTRLAALLAPTQRKRLALAMARHVVDEIKKVSAIKRLYLLSPDVPPIADVEWIADEGRGLNAELGAHIAQLGAERLLIIHADLPVVSSVDIEMLLLKDTTLAADWRGEGTNAIATTDPASLALHFGPGSLATHRAAMPHAATIERPGLGCDLDTPDDVEHLVALEQARSISWWQDFLPALLPSHV